MQVLLTRGGAYREITLGFSWAVMFFGGIALAVQRNWSALGAYLAVQFGAFIVTMTTAGSGDRAMIIWPLLAVVGTAFIANWSNAARAEALISRGWRVIPEDWDKADAKLSQRLRTWELA